MSIENILSSQIGTEAKIGDVPTIEQVKTLWDQVRRRHIPIALGCACGALSAHISPADFEDDLLAFLEDRYPPIRVALGLPEASRTIAALLDGLERTLPDVAMRERLLADAKRSLESFAPQSRFKAERVN